MSVETHLYDLTCQVRDLVGCGTVNLLIGCPEPKLRHPLLDLFPTNSYRYMGSNGLTGIDLLLADEQVRALCDLAVQSGQVHSANHVHMQYGAIPIRSIAAAPLERPGGVLGLFLLIDTHTGTFNHGEHLLLSSYLSTAAKSVEQVLHNLHSALLHLYLSGARNDASMELKEILVHLEQQLERQSRNFSHADQPEEKSKRQEAAEKPPAMGDVIIAGGEEPGDEFISIISHELRIPLASIKGYAGLLQAYGTAENSAPEMTAARQRSFLNTIMEQADHLEVLIDDLLNMSHIHTGRLALRFTHVDVSLLCQQVVEAAQQRLDRQQPGRYDIRCLLDEGLPLVLADPDRVRQVITNLLENAIKYSPEGGMIEVLAHKAHISPPAGYYSSAEFEEAAIPKEPQLYVTVRDQGIGIAHEHLAQLFKPFSRLEQAGTERIPGAGLGLYIARKLVEAMNGGIVLYSSAGEGTSVTFTLPVAGEIFSYHTSR
jgi:signal transduction histidine kinase